MGVNREPQHLLDNAEQNVGNSATLYPQVGPGGPLVDSGTVIPQSNPSRILQLSGPSSKGQTTSIVMTVTRLVGAQNPKPGYPGPITGIIEFGNGGRSTKVEFDIPVGPFIGSVLAADPASEPQDGGVIVTVPTGVLRAYARYDNLLIAPLLNQPAPISLAQLRGVSFIGPGGPVQRLPPNPPILAEPVLAKAMAAYFSRHTSLVYKTLYLYTNQVNSGPPLAIPVASNPAIDPATSPVFYALPAFARSVKVIRMPVTAALECTLSNGINVIDAFSIPSGASPTIPIIGHENVIGIRSADFTPANEVLKLALVCEIGI
jgi:hypothetical protein